MSTDSTGPEPQAELAALGRLDPADVFALADAAHSRARGQVVGEHLAQSVARWVRTGDTDHDPVLGGLLAAIVDVPALTGPERGELGALLLAAHDQVAAADNDAAGLTRLIRQRGLVP